VLNCFSTSNYLVILLSHAYSLLAVPAVYFCGIPTEEVREIGERARDRNRVSEREGGREGGGEGRERDRE
jgi:hypothetical protein